MPGSSPESNSVVAETTEIASILFVVHISMDSPQAARYPASMPAMAVSVTSHSRASISWMSTVTTMMTVASCCNTEEGMSASQLMACAAVCTSASTPLVIPPMYTANTMTMTAPTSDSAARVKSPKSWVRLGATSSICMSVLSVMRAVPDYDYGCGRKMDGRC